LLPDKDIAVHSYAAEMNDKYSDSEKFRDSALTGGIVTLLICLADCLYMAIEICRKGRLNLLLFAGCALAADTRMSFQAERNGL
jgi:hypothetical protein